MGHEERDLADAPAWFASAIAHVPAYDDIEVAGCRIRLRSWGDGGARPVVLVHGAAAHAAWWDHIAPYLASDRRVVALDLSGHGDSNWRAAYTAELWACEVGVTARYAIGAGGAAPIVIGHSMGGRAATILAAESPDLVAGLMLIDSPLEDREFQDERLERRRRPTRLYASVEEARARWVTLPPQQGNVPAVEEYVARHSIRPAGERWTWKFDPQFFGRLATVADAPSRVRCPFVLLRSEHGIIGAEALASVRRRLDGRLSVVEMPGTGHHPMLDQPLQLIGALRSLLTVWPWPTSRPDAG